MKHSIQLLVMFVASVSILMPPVAIAQQAGAVAGAGGAGGELGRVFYDEAQRRVLEQSVVPDGTNDTKNGEPTVAGDIRFNGVMRIRGGQTNAWVNGAVLEADRQGGADNTTGLNIELLGESLVVRHESGQTVLRAGDSLNELGDHTPPAGADQ